MRASINCAPCRPRRRLCPPDSCLLNVEHLLGCEARKSQDFCDGRRVPAASEPLRLWAVETHGEIEWPLRCREPVGFLVLARAFILEIEVQGAIGIIVEWHPAAYCEAIEAVRDLEAVAIVERD